METGTRRLRLSVRGSFLSVLQAYIETNFIPLDEIEMENPHAHTDFPVPQKTLEEAKQQIKEALEKQKQEAIDTAIKLIETTQKSDREIAKQVGLSHPTIAKLRKQFEVTNEVKKEREQLAFELSKSTQQVNDAKYKMEMIDLENQSLKFEASKKQQDQECHQSEKNNSLIYIEPEKRQDEIKRQNTELQILKQTLDLENEQKYREVKLRKILVSFCEFTVKLSQQQLDLLKGNFTDYLAKYQEIISQLKTWGNILAEAIFSFQNY